jgi:hypothetical protein
MMANTHDIGDTVRVSASFAQNAVAIDPTTVAVVIREPNGAQTRYTYLTDAALVRAATGSYYLDYDATMPGTHWYRWVSTGTGKGASEDHFEVRPMQVTP